MSAGSYNFTIEQAAKFSRVLTWKDAAGARVPLTGFTATMKIWDKDTGVLLLTLTTTPDVNGNVITLGGTAGTITILIKTVTTTTFTFSEAKYKLRLNDSSGEGNRLIEGSLSFSKESA